MNATTPTQETYQVLQRAYDFFNGELFEDKLPQCLITLSNEMRRAYGYYRHHPFEAKKGKKKPDPDKLVVDEIALNPFTFTGREDREIFSTLVHEMVHLWQHHFGLDNKKTAHDKEWAAKMEEIGLMPSSTGAPGGKRTGRRVSHYIIEDGEFSKAARKFKEDIPWRGAPIERPVRGSKRVKHVCPTCEVNAYSKPGVSLICGECQEPMETS